MEDNVRLPRSAEDLDAYNIDELRDVARVMGIRLATTASRDQIASLLRYYLPSTVTEVDSTGSSNHALPTVRSWRQRAEPVQPSQHTQHLGRQVLLAKSRPELDDLALCHGLYMDNDVPKSEVVEILMKHFMEHHSNLMIAGDGGNGPPKFNTAAFGTAVSCFHRQETYDEVMEDRYDAVFGAVDVNALESFQTPIVMQDNPARRQLRSVRHIPSESGPPFMTAHGDDKPTSALENRINIAGNPLLHRAMNRQHPQLQLHTHHGSIPNTPVIVQTPPILHNSHSNDNRQPFSRGPDTRRPAPIIPSSNSGASSTQSTNSRTHFLFPSTPASTTPTSPNTPQHPYGDRAAAQHQRLGGGVVKRWAPPDMKVAQRHIDSVHPRVRDARTGMKRPYPIGKTRTGRHCFDCCDFFHEGTMSTFADLGAGVTLYFKFLKWGIGTFFALSVVYMPLLVLNCLGNTPVGSLGGFTLSDTTLGNLGDRVNFTRVYLPATTCGSERCSISKSDAAVVYGYTDLIAVVVFVLSYLWLRMFERTEAACVDRLSTTIADYSIAVTHIPEDTTQPELFQFFEQLTGCAVAEVSIARDDSELVTLSIQRGRIIRKLEILDEQMAIAIDKRRGESKMKRFRSRRAGMVNAVKDIAARQARLKASVKALEAFVTFEDQAGFMAALDAYPKSIVQYWMQPPHKRLRGVHRLKVDRAPDPSTILWENLGAGMGNRLLRRLVTTVVSLLLVAISFILLCWASYQQKKAKSSGGDEACPSFDVTPANATAHPGWLHCYCTSLGAEALSSGICQSWIRSRTVAVLITILASASVVMVNVVLNFLMAILTHFERHHSLDTEALSMSRRLFLVQFVNTGIVVLLANASFIFIQGASGTRYSDFSSDWYTSVGSSVIITMLLNIFSPQVSVILKVFWALCKRKYIKPRSQRELNTLYTGPDFLLTARYSQVLNTMFVTLMYSAGIPVLVPICVGMLTVAYWVDKILLCRFYRTPPLYNEKLGVYMSSLLPYAVVVHLAFAVWMLGNRSIFQSSTFSLSELDQAAAATGVLGTQDATGRRVRQRHVFPLFLTLLGVAGVIVASKLLMGAKAAMTKVLSFLLCGYVLSDIEFDKKFRLEQPVPPLSIARQTHLLRGLTSYNILKNPRFASAFAISASFADRHTEVSEVLSATIDATSAFDAQLIEAAVHS